jgi:hypothetical protein
MQARDLIQQSLPAIRDRVCDECPHRSRVDGRCAEPNPHCRLEAQLPRFIAVVLQAELRLGAPYVEPDAHWVCDWCIAEQRDLSLCPAPNAAVRVVEAVQAIERRHEDLERLRRHLNVPRPRERVPVAEFFRAYEETTGVCLGCD